MHPCVSLCNTANTTVTHPDDWQTHPQNREPLRCLKPGVANRRRGRKKQGVEPPRHLLVDGYNVLHAWSWLSAHDTSAGIREVARARLVEAVRPLHDLERWRVTVVFDGRGVAVDRDAGVSESGFTVLYAPADRTADSVIEALVAASPDPTQCVVATADGPERETVAAAGATCMSPADLLAWCERCRARAAQAVLRRAEKSRGSWGNKLPL